MIQYITEPSEGYELIDSGHGHRLERFGQRTIVRPDASILWEPTSPNHPSWINPDLEFRAERSGSWDFRKEEFAEGWEVALSEGVRVLVKPTPFKHVGVFPEQMPNWEWLEKIIKKTDGKVRVLNLFGYTGIASIYAAKAGAEVTHVDASKGTVFWASENARRSGLNEKGIRWIVDDVSKFVQREVRRGAKYDVIIMDPPVFGRGTKGEIWRLEEDIAPLVADVAQLLSNKPVGFLLNFYATALYPESFARLVEEHMRVKVEVATLDIRESESKKLLQSGFSIRSFN